MSNCNKQDDELVTTTTDENARPLRPPRDSFAALQNLVAPLRRVDGKHAVCCWCGFIGNNHAKCQRCRRVFHRPPRAIRPTFKNSFTQQFTSDVENCEQSSPVDATTYYIDQNVAPVPVMPGCVCCPVVDATGLLNQQHNHMMAPYAEPEVIDIALLDRGHNLPTPPCARRYINEPEIIDLVELDNNMGVNGRVPEPNMFAAEVVVDPIVEVDVENGGELQQQPPPPAPPSTPENRGDAAAVGNINNNVDDGGLRQLPPTITEAMNAALLLCSYSNAAPEALQDREFQDKVFDVMKSLEKINAERDG